MWCCGMLSGGGFDGHWDGDGDGLVGREMVSVDGEGGCAAGEKPTISSTRPLGLGTSTCCASLPP